MQAAVTIPWPLPSFEDLTDDLLDALRGEPKKVARSSKKKEVEGHIQRSWQLESSSEPERTYRVYTRQLIAVQPKFSCGLVLELAGRKLTLCRYNGPSHPHSNPLPPKERCPSEIAHRHKAIAKYLAAGLPGDRYAESDDRFTTLQGALYYLVQDCAIIGLPTEPESPGLWSQQPLDV